MSSINKYKIVNSPSKGEILVATKDILPGELILHEPEPILSFSSEYVKSFEAIMSRKDAYCVASFNTYKKVLSSEAQKAFLSLVGPTKGYYPDLYRTWAKRVMYSDLDDEQSRRLTASEVEEYVKVASVVKLSGLVDCVYDSHCFVFAEMTRFSHSCISNCRFVIESSTCSCYARVHIKEGEELTSSCMGDDTDSLPTHERRQKYLQHKDFSCHCPRCDAEGDDTRQFDCYDTICKGVMMVCQPLRRRSFYLLPCSVCFRSAPAAYQAHMLDLESRLLQMGDQYVDRFDQLKKRQEFFGYEPLLQEIEATHFPRRHLKSLNILWTVMRLKKEYLTIAVHTTNATAIANYRADVLLAAREYIAVQERIFPHPCVNTHEVLQRTVNCCILDWPTHMPAIYSPQETKELLQKILRMSLVMKGREDRDARLDACLLQTLQTLPLAPAVTSDELCDVQTVTALKVCTFCEESPLRAALTLSPCDKCRQVAYCSVGCQKAHWKLHKQTCSALTTSEWS